MVSMYYFCMRQMQHDGAPEPLRDMILLLSSSLEFLGTSKILSITADCR